MNYNEHYNRLILRGQNRVLEGYNEVLQIPICYSLVCRIYRENKHLSEAYSYLA
jgi:hypothetical protein